MTATDPQSIAVQLHDWFESILRLTEESLFGVAPEGPHRDAVVLDRMPAAGNFLDGRALASGDEQCDRPAEPAGEHS